MTVQNLSHDRLEAAQESGALPRGATASIKAPKVPNPFDAAPHVPNIAPIPQRHSPGFVDEDAAANGTVAQRPDACDDLEAPSGPQLAQNGGEDDSVGTGLALVLLVLVVGGGFAALVGGNAGKFMFILSMLAAMVQGSSAGKTRGSSKRKPSSPASVQARNFKRRHR